MKSASSVLVAAAVLASIRTASAQIPPSITTPDRVESRVGRLDFKDGVPSKATVDKMYDQIDFTHAYSAFMNSLSGVSIHAARKGLQSIGVQDNEVIVFRT